MYSPIIFYLGIVAMWIFIVLLALMPVIGILSRPDWFIAVPLIIVTIFVGSRLSIFLISRGVVGWIVLALLIGGCLKLYRSAVQGTAINVDFSGTGDTILTFFIIIGGGTIGGLLIGTRLGRRLLFLIILILLIYMHFFSR